GTNVKLTSIGMGYHTFGLEWNQNQYIFYVDGKETWRTSTAVSQIPQYMILSTELTGWGGDPETGNFPDQVVFDYVRVYQPK
ncbi:MAG TPA: glycoside hydrolase family 16 protein, partial [Sphingobacteriaceae bacterium]